MLTIRTPIALTVDPSILTVSDNFTNRIEDNYNQINADIEAIDMLHFISEPASVYVGEGGMTALVENTQLNHNQELKVNLINSVLNRILVSDTYEMTYQDNVFISNMLRKMGVTDVAQFMRQVNVLKQETRNINELIDLYWNGGEVLEQYRTFIEEQKKENEADNEEDNEGRSVYYLHQDIFNRLSTGAIYQELLNFASAHYDSNSYISDVEMQLSEQNIAASNILLNKLKNYYSYEEAPLEYSRLNVFELGDEYTFKQDSRQTNSELISAVLLNTLNQMYSMRYNELSSSKDVWFRIENALYETAYNTFERFNSYHNRLEISKEVTEQYMSRLVNHQEGEIRALNQLFENSEAALSEVTQYLDNSQNITELDENAIEEATQRMEPTQLINYVNQLAQDNSRHNQQIIRVTDEEKLLKQQLDFFNQQNIIRQQQLREEILNAPENVNIDQTTLAERVLMEAVNNPPRFSLEYLMEAGNLTPEEVGIEYLPSSEEVTTQMVENLRRRNDRRINNITESNYTELNLTHRVEREDISEEVLEEIRNVNRVTRQDVERTVETVNNTETIHEIVTNRINDLQVNTRHELEDMVSRNVSGQLQDIYDRVYTKLEKKMDTERRRRGL